MPEQRRGRDAPRHPQLCQRVLHDEKRGLREARLIQPLLRAAQHFPQICPEHRLQNFRAAIHFGAKDGLALVQLAAHAHGLRALAGKKEDDLRGGAVGLTRDEPLRIATAQRGGGIRGVGADQHPPVRKRGAAGLQSERRVREIRLRVRGEMRGEIRRRGVESGRGFRREHEELLRSRCARRFERRSLFQNGVRVRAAGAEGADARAPRGRAGFPLGQRGVHVERAAGEIDLRIRLREMQRRRQHAVLQRERRLDEACHARRCVEVADVRFHRAERAEIFRAGARAKGLREPGDFDGIAERRGRAVRLDVGDRLRLHAGQCVR